MLSMDTNTFENWSTDQNLTWRKDCVIQFRVIARNFNSMPACTTFSNPRVLYDLLAQNQKVL